MGDGVVVDICDPNARSVRLGDVHWVVFGHVEDLAAHLDERDDPLRAADRFVTAERRACVAFVEEQAGVPVRVGLRRGLLAPANVFYRWQGGTVAVDDIFRNAVRRVPPPDRIPSPEATVAHYLCRRVLPPLSYVPSVGALATATAVDLDLARGTTSERVVDRLDVPSERRSAQEYVDDLEQALDQAVARLPTGSDAALMFSGGIDSTLTLTFAGNVRLLTIVPDSPESHRETAYAQRAALLANTSFEEVGVREADYGDRLRETLIALGYPPVHDMMAYKADLFAVAPQNILTGLSADSLFGGDSRSIRVALRATSAPVRRAVDVAARIAPGDLRRRAGRLMGEVDALNADPYGLDGMAANAFVSGDKDEISRLGGRVLVDRVVGRFAADVFARWATAGDDDRTVNLEARHIAFLVGGSTRNERVLALELSQRVFTPFEDPRVVEVALRVPPQERFVREGVLKWLPKRLLERRLPGYPVAQEKLHSALPVARYYRSGALADIWERYELPEFLDEAGRRRVRSQFDMMTWNAISHAMWLEHIAREESLPAYPATVSMEFAPAAPA